MDASTQALPTSSLSPVRVARLPPIPSSPSQENGGGATAASKVALQAATSELRDSMQHLLTEVRESIHTYA